MSTEDIPTSITGQGQPESSTSSGTTSLCFNTGLGSSTCTPVVHHGSVNLAVLAEHDLDRLATGAAEDADNCGPSTSSDPIKVEDPPPETSRDFPTRPLYRCLNAFCTTSGTKEVIASHRVGCDGLHAMLSSLRSELNTETTLANTSVEECMIAKEDLAKAMKDLRPALNRCERLAMQVDKLKAEKEDEKQQKLDALRELAQAKKMLGFSRGEATLSSS
ncbi:hypothetical protein MNV49_007454 [Pseudohyphozyma bogoriensis]|nr:hypothetical protein MNV49_007454 [Pseudohyphozyma bogoriensis]